MHFLKQIVCICEYMTSSYCGIDLRKWWRVIWMSIYFPIDLCFQKVQTTIVTKSTEFRIDNNL